MDKQLAINIAIIIIGILVGFFSPTRYKGINILSIALVYLRRCKYTKFLTLSVPGTDNDTWDLNAVELEMKQKMFKNI